MAALTTNVATSVVGPYPMLRVTRVGGPSGRRLDSARIQVEAWGAPNVAAKSALSLLARTALGALDEVPAVFDGVALGYVAHLVTMQWLPDEATAQGRYLHQVTVYAHAT